MTLRRHRARLRKISSNFGAGAYQTLGIDGYLRYLLAALSHMPEVIREGDLRPVDKAMSGVLALRHPIARADVMLDLDAYREGDDDEGTYVFGLVREIWIRNVYLSHFDLPDRLGCVLDLGANRGIFTLQAAAMCERVVAVEPLRKYGDPLVRNLALNRFDNVRTLLATVGQAVVPGCDATAYSLADIIQRAGNGTIDLVKMDIEGSEFGLDFSCLAEVKRLAMEIHPAAGEPAGLVARVAAEGFDCRTYDDQLRPTPPGNADFLVAINKRHQGVRWGDGASATEGAPATSPATMDRTEA